LTLTLPHVLSPIHVFFDPYTILLAKFTLFIGEEGEVEFVFGLKAVVLFDAVLGDPNDFSVTFGEFRHGVPKAAGFLRATRGIVPWIEVKDDRFAFKRRKVAFASAIGRQFKARRLVANVHCHLLVPV
jgi:hypothetical protein